MVVLDPLVLDLPVLVLGPSVPVLDPPVPVLDLLVAPPPGSAVPVLDPLLVPILDPLVVAPPLDPLLVALRGSCEMSAALMSPVWLWALCARPARPKSDPQRLKPFSHW